MRPAVFTHPRVWGERASHAISITSEMEASGRRVSSGTLPLLNATPGDIEAMPSTRSVSSPATRCRSIGKWGARNLLPQPRCRVRQAAGCRYGKLPTR